jgi:hypothetical protein
VFSFTLQPPYSRAKRTQYTLKRRLGVPESRSAHFKQEKNLLLLLGIEP